VTWQENLALVTSSLQERKSWATTIERDAMELNKMKKRPVPPSATFVQGPKSLKPGSVALAKLLVTSALQARVTLPKKFMADLETTILPERYVDLSSQV